MDVWVNSNGTRNKDFRPLIQNEWLAYSAVPYSPNGPGVHYGLYDSAQQTCPPYVTNWDHFKGGPVGVVDNFGRLHRLPVQGGFPSVYGPLINNVRGL